MLPSYDRFSLLPDSLLLIIISLLPFKEATRICILSKRWLHLWRQLTNIEFNEFYFVKFDAPHYERVAQRGNFLNFVSFWIHNHGDTTIEKLLLTLSNPNEAIEIVESCVSFATRFGVKELELDLSDPNWFDRDHRNPMALFELPSYVYEHKVIKSLKLYSCGFLETELIKLHALKQVSLGWIELRNDAINTMLSNCKMIESLSMKKCWNSTKFDCGSDDLRLRRLVVDSCNFHDAFILNAPNLTYFKYYGETKVFEIENSFDIEEADVDFGDEYVDILDQHSFMQKIIRDLHHAKVLTICSYILQVLHIGQGSRTEYDMNVRHLKIKTSMHNNELIGVSFFLNSCSMLECLTFELGLGRLIDEDSSSDENDGLDSDDPDDYDSHDDDETSSLENDNQRSWIKNLSICQCLTSTLKTVEMNNFTGTENEVYMLYYLIHCGSVLKKINIYVRKEVADNVAFCSYIERIVLACPRASSDLEISFHR